MSMGLFYSPMSMSSEPTGLSQRWVEAWLASTRRDKEARRALPRDVTRGTCAESGSARVFHPVEDGTEARA